MTERMTEYNMGVTDERIVRCRDCERHCKDMAAYNTCDRNGGYWDDDDYCSRAEPKGEQS